MKNIPIPAFCPEHGIFPVTNFMQGDEGVIASFTLQNSNAQCPKCGRKSEILPGHYDLSIQGLNLLLDPSISEDALQALRDLAEKVARREISVDEATEAAPKISNKFEFLTQLTRAEKLQVFAIIVPVIATLLGAKMSGGTTIINNYVSAPKQAISEHLTSTPKFLKLPEVGPIPASRPLRGEEQLRRGSSLAPFRLAPRLR